jgi:hypothetical protein
MLILGEHLIETRCDFEKFKFLSKLKLDAIISQTFFMRLPVEGTGLLGVWGTIYKRIAQLTVR